MQELRTPVVEADEPDLLAAREETSLVLANQAHIYTLRICLSASVVLIVCLGAALFFASTRKPIISVIRTDNVRGAELISIPSQSAAGLKTADARAFLWDWCILRYRILKGDAEENLKRSRIAMSGALAAKYYLPDVKRVAEVIAGKTPEQTVEYRFISITPLRREERKGNTVLLGHALIKLVTRHNLLVPSDQDDTKQAVRIDLDFYLDPMYAAEQAQHGDVAYQIYNPLGVTITDMWETAIPMAEGE